MIFIDDMEPVQRAVGNRREVDARRRARAPLRGEDNVE